MKNDTILIAAAAAAGLFMVYRMTRAGTSTIVGTAQSLNNGGTVGSTATLVPNTATPGQPGWAWTYYTDGTAIAPNGDYYLNGTLVWKAGQ
jgi:hypothetical protein